MEQKPSKTRHRKYDADCKKEVIRMAESGRRVPDISEPPGVGTNFVYTWIKRSKVKSVDKKITDADISLDEEKLAMHKRHAL
jgi:transposase-like protein